MLTIAGINTAHYPSHKAKKYFLFCSTPTPPSADMKGRTIGDITKNGLFLGARVCACVCVWGRFASHF